MCEITGNFHRCNIFFEKFCQEGRYGGNGVKSSSPSGRRERPERREHTRPMGMQELESQYQAKTDEELLRLVVELEKLTPEAQVQLHIELAKRGIGEARREDFRAEKNQTRTETTEG